jgi:hypothetical protein
MRICWLHVYAACMGFKELFDNLGISLEIIPTRLTDINVSEWGLSSAKKLTPALLHTTFKPPIRDFALWNASREQNISYQ